MVGIRREGEYGVVLVGGSRGRYSGGVVGMLVRQERERDKEEEGQ